MMPIRVATRHLTCYRISVNISPLPHAGLADPNALSQAVAAYNACQYVGLPGCEVISTELFYITCYTVQFISPF